MKKPKIIVESETVPTRVFGATIKLQYFEDFALSSDKKKFQESIHDAHEGWEPGEGWESLFKRGVFRFNKNSNCSDTKLNLTFEQNALCMQMDQASVHVNCLVSLANLLLSRHENTTPFSQDEIEEFDIDMEQFPSPGKASDRIKYIELSNIFGSEDLVSSQLITNSSYIPRANIHLEFSSPSKRSFLESINEFVDDSRLILSGPQGFNFRDQRDYIEIFEDAEAAGLFNEVVHSASSSTDIIEVFSSDDNNLIMDEFVYRYYHITEFLNVLNYDHGQKIMLEVEENEL